MSDKKFTLSRRALAALPLLAGLGLAAGAQAKAARALNAEDKLAIQDLFSNYVWAYDCGDHESFITLFTDDAVVNGRGKMYNDRAAIMSWFDYLLKMRDTEGDDIWMHEAGQFRYDGNADKCIVYAYATHFNGNTKTTARGVRSLGYFVCECVKVKGAWKFRRFSITTWDKSIVPWKKPLPWPQG